MPPRRDVGGRTPPDPAGRDLLLELSRPELAASVSDLDAAESILVFGIDPLHSMPILDLRIRKVVRRHNARLAIATDRPSALDGGAEETARYAPGFAPGFAAALGGAVGADGYEAAQGELGEDAERIAGALRPGATVIVWGGSAGRALLDIAAKLDAKLLEAPDGANTRGLREVGCLPDAGPGFSEVSDGRNAAEIRDALAAGDLDAALLVNADPVRDFPGGPEWSEALTKASFVASVAMFEDASTRRADVVFPAESYAEKEGTVTHPDGRLQRLRPGVPHPGQVRPTWQVLVELCALLGDETDIDSAPEALGALAAEVPFYAGITHEEIGGRGIRWQEREAASAFRSDGAGARDEVPHPASPTEPKVQRSPSAPSAAEPAAPLAPEPAASEQARMTGRPSGSLVAEGEASGGVVVGSYRDLWASEVADRSPALRFLAPEQTLDLAPADADRLGLAQGDEVEVRSNGTSLRARVAIRQRVRPGSGFLIEGTAEANANALSPGELAEVIRAGGEA